MYERRDFRLFLCKHHFHSVDNLSRMYWAAVGTIPKRTVSICLFRMVLGQQKELFFYLH